MHDLSGLNCEYYYNPKLISAFCSYFDNINDLYLWAITGDLDNLGVFVAQNGRATAENLVDLYNRVIEKYIKDWYKVNNKLVISIVFMPCGEEVFIVGVCREKRVVQRLFSTMKNDINIEMSKQKFMEVADTKASFGGAIIENSEIDENIKLLVLKYSQDKSNQAIYPTYLNLLCKIRNILAKELDKAKFNDILSGKYPVQVRQIVLAQMLLYKINTRRIITSLNKINKDNALKNLMQIAGSTYGIKYKQAQLINKMLNNIYESKS